ncbi:MAG: carboxypeptidase-like regulatory domain-containing protein [Bacteroidales bacterium]|nr:carboxypeptidase-like regulatory domain-containing protein [Bacteroidales bacterium]
MKEMIFCKIKYIVLFFCVCICLSFNLIGQNTVITGIIKDAKTGEPLPFVNISTNSKSSSAQGTMTNVEGVYTLKVAQNFDSVIFQFIGYETVKQKIKPHQTQRLNIDMKPVSTQLSEAKVVAKREKYSRKNNPAVILMENVQAHKDQNNITNQSFYQYRSHEKTELSLLGINDSLRNNIAFKKMGFLFDNLQTSEFDERKYMPVYFMEQLFEKQYRKKPECQKSMLMGQKTLALSKFIEPQTVEFMLTDAFGKINVYDNYIRLLSNDIVSPLASYGTRFYQFFITDTTELKGDSCIVLAFNPANMRDIGFSGKLWITKDSNYAVKKIFLDFPKKSSINFVKNLSVWQEYERIDGQLCLVEDKTLLDGSFYGMNMYGKKQIFYSDYIFGKNLGDKFYTNNDVTTRVDGYNKRTNSWWEENRISPLTTNEQNTYDIPSKLNNFTGYKIIMNTLMAFVSGYVDLGWFDYGPVENTLSWNSVEGVRFRVGGKTNVNFNKHWFLNGFVAYGTKDKEVKYNAEVMYSFADKLYHQWEFPINLLTVGIEHNTEIPGQRLLMGTYDRLFLSFNRGNIDMMTLNTKLYAEYWYETMKQFSTKFRVEYFEMEPLAMLTFTSYDGTKTYNNIRTTTFNLELRYAKNEQFIQSQKYRMTTNSTAPIYTINYSYAADILDASYTFHKLKASINKRWFILNFGFADLTLEGGKVFGKAAYPLLFVHQANQNWAYQDESFNLMNYFEFVSDYYGQMVFNYNFNGYIFNRIPLIKHLKLREVFAVKAIWGGITKDNRPSANNPELIDFSKDNNGEYKTYYLDNTPYLEANVGIDNLFKVLRVDYVRRFTYLEHHGIAKWGIRFRLRFTF